MGLHTILPPTTTSLQPHSRSSPNWTVTWHETRKPQKENLLKILFSPILNYFCGKMWGLLRLSLWWGCNYSILYIFGSADKLFIGFQYCYVLWICDENTGNKILKILDNLEFRKKQNRINISPHSSSCCSSIHRQLRRHRMIPCRPPRSLSPERRGPPWPRRTLPPPCPPRRTSARRLSAAIKA